MNLKSIYGATEFGVPCLPHLKRGHEEDWDFVEFSSRAKIRWVDEGNGRYECQFLVGIFSSSDQGKEADTQNSKTCDTHHPSVENMENPRGYATADLYEKHPTKPNLWRM